MIRVIDFSLALLGLLVAFPVLLIIFFLGLLDTGSPLFVQKRMGMNMKAFYLIKFRTMKLDTVSVASHLADNASVTKFGRFLRLSKLDELPQLWNVVKGEMSLVGPRPNLLEQEVLIACRQKLGVYSVRPGITGLAQVNKVDMSEPRLLARIDSLMIRNFSVCMYLGCIVSTIWGRGFGDSIKKDGD